MTSTVDRPDAATARILALESATVQCSVALLADGQVVQRIAAEGSRNSDVMLPMAGQLLAEAGWRVADLHAIAFGAGPGAFTGLRVACGVAQGLALGAGLPVVGVGTLEVLAETVCPRAEASAARVAVALDARMQECYWATLAGAGHDWQVLQGPLLCAPHDVPVPEGDDWLAVGDAFALHAAVLAARLGDGVRLAPGFARQPEAAALARLAALRLAAGMAVAPELAQPIYVRDKVALTSRERGAP